MMTPNDDNLIALCHEIGCSGVDPRCPGNPGCAILKKLAVMALALDLKPSTIAHLAAAGLVRGKAARGKAEEA